MAASPNQEHVLHNDIFRHCNRNSGKEIMYFWVGPLLNFVATWEVSSPCKVYKHINKVYFDVSFQYVADIVSVQCGVQSRSSIVRFQVLLHSGPVAGRCWHRHGINHKQNSISDRGESHCTPGGASRENVPLDSWRQFLKWLWISQ
jgi:hypothetical protein